MSQSNFVGSTAPIVVGSRFESKHHLRGSLALVSLHHDRDVRVEKSRKHVAIYRCRDPSCGFRITARNNPKRCVPAVVRQAMAGVEDPSADDEASSVASNPAPGNSERKPWVVCELTNHTCQPLTQLPQPRRPLAAPPGRDLEGIEAEGKVDAVNSAPGLNRTKGNQRKTALTSDLVVESLIPLVERDPGGAVSLYTASLESKYGPEARLASYHSVWRARKKAAARVFGPEGYDQVEGYCSALVAADPDCIATVKKEGESNRYKSIFVAPGALVRLWRSRKIRQVVSVDATFLRGNHDGCLFLLSCLDGCGRSLILAFGHGMAEDYDNWDWFLGRALDAFPSLNDEDTVLFSDQQKGILRAVKERLPQATHCACLFHRQQNLRCTSGLKEKAKLVEALKACAVAPTKEDCLGIIRNLPENAQTFFTQVPLEFWTHSHCPRRRWGLTTTAFAESLNAVLSKWKSLPLLAQLKNAFAKCNDLLHNSFSLYDSWLAAGKQVSDKTSKLLERHSARGRTSVIVRSAYLNNGHPTGEVIAVGAEDVQYGVDLGGRSCTCGGYQQTGVPCIHAVAVARRLGLSAVQFIDPLLLIKTNHSAYEAALPIRPVSFNNVERSNLLPPVVRRKPGRPRKRRFRSRGEEEFKRQRICKRCKQPGHYEKTCSRPSQEP